MELSRAASFHECASIFLTRPSPLIDALISDCGNGLFLTTRSEVEILSDMIDTAKYRAGLSMDNSYVENVFMEIHYRLLEEKNKLLFQVKQSLAGVNDEMAERLLLGILLDKVNEVYLSCIFLI